MVIEGSVAPGFEAVRTAFAAGQANDPGGAQLCVYRDGERVVDLWTGGYGPDQLCLTMSCTKGMTATCAHILAQRGLLDYEAPVSKYWPEFTSSATVADVLAHRAGLLSFDPPLGADLLNWDKAIGVLAGMEPFWAPGTAYMYHAVTFGHLIGEVIRRITGRTVGQFLASEIAAPLGLDMWIGLPEAEEHRVAPQVNGQVQRADFRALLEQARIDVDSRLAQAAIEANVAGMDPEGLNHRAIHAAEIPAANGITNARSLARMYAALIGPVDGVQLLDKSTVDAARAPQTDGLRAPAPFNRLLLPHPLRFGLGYGLHRSGEPMLGPGSFGHSGAGGRIGFASPERRTAVAYVCTRLAWDYPTGPDARWRPWTAALEQIA